MLFWRGWPGRRFRVVIPLRDRTIPRCSPRWTRRSACWAAPRRIVLTDNEKTVTVEHVAGSAGAQPVQAVAFARHYGVTIHTCVPADPASKGGVGDHREDRQGRPGAQGHQPAAGVRLVRRAGGGVPGVHDQVNGRVHRVTRRVPAEMLDQERARLHPVPAQPHTVAFGVTRQVAGEHPDGHLRVRPVLGAARSCSAQTVWVRVHGAGARRAGHHRARRRAGAGRGRPAPAGRRRAARGSTTSTSRRPPRGPLHREPKAKGKRRGRVPRVG